VTFNVLQLECGQMAKSFKVLIAHGKLHFHHMLMALGEMSPATLDCLNGASAQSLAKQ
jgi:hypothetical protein